jgi:hypothetical protein
MKAVSTQAWLDALRSGDYGQTKEQLGDGKGNYCCLGVLCEVAGISSDLVSSEGSLLQYAFPVPEDVQQAFFLSDTSYAESCLPDFALNIILEDLELSQVVGGMDDGPGGTEHSDKLVNRLMTLNDEGGWTFEQIADYIEDVVNAQ